MKFALLILLMTMQLTRLFAAAELQYLEKEGADFYREIARKISSRADASSADLLLCLERIRHLVLSDRVGFFYNISAQWRDGKVILSGEAERPEFKLITREVFKQLGFPNVVDQVEVVPDPVHNPEPYGLVTDLHYLTWSRPDLTGIPMDEALFGEPVYVLKEQPGVLLIKTFSGYWGYGAPAGVRRVSKKEFIENINAPKACVTRDCSSGNQRLPAGCRLPVVRWGVGANCTLQDPHGEKLPVPRKFCWKNDRAKEMKAVVDQARKFLQAPYNLGGKNTSTGIDCSGLIQMGYRAIGVNLARDAKQQYLAGHLILPSISEALLPGDAIYFMNNEGQVDHTALYIGRQEIIHATSNEVKIQSMDPNSPKYFSRFKNDYIGAKRHWW